MPLKVISFSLLYIMVWLSVNLAGNTGGIRDAEVLPILTKQGANKFGCLMDGKIWIDDSVQSIVFIDNGFLSISLWIGREKKENLVFVVPSFKNPTGVYELNTNSNGYAMYHSLHERCYFVSDNYYTGQLSIKKFDEDESIISAEFQFMAVAKQCDQIKNFVEGRFDVRYVKE